MRHLKVVSWHSGGSAPRTPRRGFAPGSEVKEVKAGAPKEFLLNKYYVTDRMYNRVIDNESKIIVTVKSYEFEKKSSKTIANINLIVFS